MSQFSVGVRKTGSREAAKKGKTNLTRSREEREDEMVFAFPKLN
jgi:hypothetical protein